MGNLIRMDLYRMLKSRTFLVCLILFFALALATAPIGKLMFTLAKSLSNELTEAFAEEAPLSGMLSDPFPMLGLMLMLLSLCFFFHADLEAGYHHSVKCYHPK